MDVNSKERFLAAAGCAELDRPPLWIMRQAGRYLPEYREMRAAHSFREMVRTPELAAEVTLQPMRRFGFDAAIVFSDILVVPEAMGLPYELKEGEGIGMAFALESAAQVAALVADAGALRERLAYVGDALRIARRELGDSTALLGFAGSPWTLACYMVEGGGARGGDFTKARRMFYEQPALFRALMDKLSDAVSAHLNLQIEAGADAVQIFDSWAAACPGAHYEQMSLRWIARIISRLPPDVPVILFAKGMAAHCDALAATGAQVLGLDWNAGLSDVAARLPADMAVQGNLDPTLLEGDPKLVRAEAVALMQSMRERPGHIVNLGHGIRPAARIDAVEALVDAVRGFSLV
ncbi:MAG: uroporphyrinogen decarboxylase [Opitutales bacterium]|jgi:uroporphyrinogen decarboxylase